jgi:hypothetical protein
MIRSLQQRGQLVAPFRVPIQYQYMQGLHLGRLQMLLVIGHRQ